MYLMDGRLGLTLNYLAFPGQSMSEDRVLEMYSVAEAIQLMRRNCPWMIPKLKSPGPFQVHTGVETYVNRSAEQTCLTIYSRIFSPKQRRTWKPLGHFWWIELSAFSSHSLYLHGVLSPQVPWCVCIRVLPSSHRTYQTTYISPGRAPLTALPHLRTPPFF